MACGRLISLWVGIGTLMEGAHGARMNADSLQVGEMHLVPSSAAQVDAPAGASAPELAARAVERACIEQVGNKFVALRTQVWPDLVPEYSCNSSEGQMNPMLCSSLEGLLERRWALEDMVGKKGTPRFRKPELDMVKEVIKTRYFSVKWARGLCMKKKTEPREEALLQCLLERSSMSMPSVAGENVTKAPSTDLLRNVEERWHLEQDLSIMDGLKHVTGHPLDEVNAAKQIKAKQIEDVKALIKQSSFSYHHTLKRCKLEFKNDTDDQGAQLLARIAMEFNDVVSKTETGECKEKEGDLMYCPEGAGPDNRRARDMSKYMSVYSAGFMTWKPMAVTTGFALGMLCGGPALATTYAALGAVPGPGFVVPIPFALAASVDIFPQCRCYPSKCEYDEEAGSCMMSQGKVSSNNPFHWLPFPGSRCVAKKTSDPNAKVKCEIKECRPKDYLQPWEQTPVKGTIGFQQEENGVHNCISTTGKVSDSLLISQVIPTETGTPLENTAQNRVRLYESMGVAIPM